MIALRRDTAESSLPSIALNHLKKRPLHGAAFFIGVSPAALEETFSSVVLNRSIPQRFKDNIDVF